MHWEDAVFRRSVHLTLVLAATVAATALAGPSQALPLTALLPEHGPVIPLKNAAMIVKTDIGYRYMAGQQDSRLVVTESQGRLHFVDTGTSELRSLPAKPCRVEPAEVGIAASCRVQKRFGHGNPMFLEIWPRLGDDYVDGSSLSAAYRLWVLADAGNDTVFGGAGDDFINGAQGDDEASGGAGDDWIRTGIGDDALWGGSGNDKLVGVAGADQIRGGDGDDRVGGGPGNDRLWGDAGADRVLCGTGLDEAWLDGADRSKTCEVTTAG